MYISRHMVFNEREFPFQYGFLNRRSPEQTIQQVVHLHSIISHDTNNLSNANSMQNRISTLSQNGRLVDEEASNNSSETGELNANTSTSDKGDTQPKEEELQHIEASTAQELKLKQINDQVPVQHDEPHNQQPMVTRSKLGMSKQKDPMLV